MRLGPSDFQEESIFQTHPVSFHKCRRVGRISRASLPRMVLAFLDREGAFDRSPGIGPMPGMNPLFGVVLLLYSIVSFLGKYVCVFFFFFLTTQRRTVDLLCAVKGWLQMMEGRPQPWTTSSGLRVFLPQHLGCTSRSPTLTEKLGAFKTCEEQLFTKALGVVLGGGFLLQACRLLLVSE